LIAKPFVAIDGDEISFPVRIHPQRNIAGQMFAACGGHPLKIQKLKQALQSKNTPDSDTAEWWMESRCDSICLRSGHLLRGPTAGARKIPPPLRCAGRRNGRSAATATNKSAKLRPLQAMFASPNKSRSPNAVLGHSGFSWI
jgi:hypothetical protein